MYSNFSDWSLFGHSFCYKKTEGLININKLHPEMKEILLKVHARHTATMGAVEKEKHSLERIKKVKVTSTCLEVYYEYDWYHYIPQGTWY